MFPVGVEVKALTTGMHASIGAAAALDLDGCGKDIRQGGFEVVLHGAAMGLSLPTLKVCAIVGAYAFPTHRQHCVAFGEVVKSEVVGILALVYFTLCFNGSAGGFWVDDYSDVV